MSVIAPPKSNAKPDVSVKNCRNNMLSDAVPGANATTLSASNSKRLSAIVGAIRLNVAVTESYEGYDKAPFSIQ